MFYGFPLPLEFCVYRKPYIFLSILRVLQFSFHEMGFFGLLYLDKFITPVIRVIRLL